MLTVSGLRHGFAGRTLFADVSLQLNRGDRVGLVGANGAGKSTFFSIILGKLEAEAGEIHFERHMRLGFLPQESMPVDEETVLQIACGAVTGEGKQDSAEVHDASVFQHEAKAKRILSGLGFRNGDFGRLAKELSGGWVMRAHLARLLVDEPELLMLDEPTNHLDLHALLWFQEYLKGYPGAILLISHDRAFLNALVNNIWEIDAARLHRYSGDYDSYLSEREIRFEQLKAAYENQQKEIERLMAFVKRFGAKNTKASQAQSKLKQIERMEKLEAPVDTRKKVSIRFPQPERSGQRVVRLENVVQAYGENVVYEGLDFESDRGKRIALVGPNGAGKSTLMKILAGVVEIRSGLRELGHKVKVGYFSQYRADMLDSRRSVLDEALDTPRSVTVEFVRTLLGTFLFTGDDVFKSVGVLSGGEKTRLALAKILLDPPNLLLMDEPTTHLDIPSIDALVEALKQYLGTLIFISHDVYFIREIGNHVIHVESGKLKHYPGDYQYYLDKRAMNSDRADLSDSEMAGTSGAIGRPEEFKVSKKDRKRQEAEERQQRYQASKSYKKRVAELEKEIEAYETRLAELTEALEKPETYDSPGKAQELNRELMGVQEVLDRANAEWEATAEALAEVESG